MKFNQNFSVLFWLARAKQNKSGLVPIYVRITVDGERSECSTGRQIDPQYWDVENEQATDEYLEASVLNEYLLLVRAEIRKPYNLLLSTSDHVTAEQVKLSYQGKH